MNPIRIALSVLLAALIAAPARAQEQSAPTATAAESTAAAAPATGPMRIRVGGNVQMPKLVHTVWPKFSAEAKKSRPTGTLVLHVVVATDGTVKTVEYVSGPVELTDASIEAVKQWRYKPTLLNGERVEVETTVNIVFSIGSH